MGAALINNLTTNVILNFNFQVLLNIFFYSAAETTGILINSKMITLIFEEVVKGFSYKWTIRYKDKKDLGMEVIKIVTEGSTTGWNIKPRNMEHVYFIANRLEMIDSEVANNFNICISSWVLNATRQEVQEASIENISFCKELQEKAQNACKEVKKVVSKWN